MDGVVESDGDGEGENLTNLSSNPAANDGFPAFSPEGNQIVFRSNRTGTDYEVFVIDMDGTELTQLTTNSVADNRPDWGVAPV
jgi:Tol biopolymer transport system component